MKAQAHIQVLIIGSGAGGAVSALELATSGMDVLVLEEGGRYGLEDYGASPPEAMKKLYRRRGMTPIIGPVSIGYVEGCCVGGSTEINSGFWQRTPRELLHLWKSRYDLAHASPEDLKPHFEIVEKFLHVGLMPGDWPASTRVFARGIKAMGWSAEEAPRMALNCVNTNACASGCPKGAKQGMSRSLIPLAEAAGARIKPHCRVKSLIKTGNRIVGVLAEQRNDDGSEELVRIDADHVFVCAGPTETPALLRRSGIKHNVGNTLCIHPMLKVVARFKEEINAEHSVLSLLQVREFWPEMTLGGSFYSFGHLALLLSDNWPWTREYMKWRRHMSAYYVAVRGTGRGYVRAPPLQDRTSIIRYHLSNDDLANLSKGLARLSTLLLAGDAVEVYPCVYGLPSIRTETQAMRWLEERLPGKALSLTTVHAFCACPIGQRRDRCAADSFGKVYNFENLYINDASMLPDSPGVNPQASIMALARRNAIHFKEQQK
jgi:choline dehydrogenase-like flavoprotein